MSDQDQPEWVKEWEEFKSDNLSSANPLNLVLNLQLDPRIQYQIKKDLKKAKALSPTRLLLLLLISLLSLWLARQF